jgi:hypothetical protein
VELEVRCSAGTYIRSLARDLGEQLGCGGALARLRRTATLGFDLSTAVDLERLASAPPPPLLDPLAALAHLERRQLLEEELPGWRCGRALPLRAGDVDQVGNGPAAALPHARPELPGGFATPDPLPRSNLGEAIREASAAAPDGPADPAGPAKSEAPEGPAYAILNPDGSLAGIARLDPTGQLRPRLVFDAAG